MPARALGRRDDRPCRSATLVGTRSGDKGGDANVGVWVRSDAHWPWLANTLTVERFQQLLPETAAAAGHPTRPAEPARAELRRRGHPRRRRRLQRAARSAGEGARRVAGVARRRHPRRSCSHERRRTPPSGARCARRSGASSTHDVLPYQDAWEAAGELPRTLHERAAALGLIGLAYPGVGRRRGRRRARRARPRRGDALRGRRRRRVRVAVHVRHLVAAPGRGGRSGAGRAMGAADDRGTADRVARDHRAGRRLGRRRASARPRSGTATTTSSTARRPTSPPGCAPTSS